MDQPCGPGRGGWACAPDDAIDAIKASADSETMMPGASKDMDFMAVSRHYGVSTFIDMDLPYRLTRAGAVNIGKEMFRTPV